MKVTYPNLRIAALATIVVTLSLSAAAIGQSSYPQRSVKIVVPVPPGPLLDTLPRMLGEKLREKLGQPIIIENRPGASQSIGAEAVFRAEPDGYTLLISPPAPLVVSQHLSPKPSFDPVAFVPVTQLISFPHVVVINPKLAISTLSDLIAYAKANPGKMTYGSPGPASTPHLAMEKLFSDAGIRLVHVPYQGMGPAQRDLIAGHIDVMLDAPGNVMQQITDGKLKPIAITGDRRLAELANVPTVSETLPGFVHTEWFAIVAPPQTPPDVVGKLSKAIAEVLRLPEIEMKLKGLAVTPVGSSPAEAAAFLKSESDRWRQIVADTGVPAK